MGAASKQDLIQLWKKTKLYMADKLEDYVPKEQLPQEMAKHLADVKFVNPQSLTFTGAVEAEYDGSEMMSVEIPEKETAVLEETVLASGTIPVDKSGSRIETGLTLGDLRKWKMWGYLSVCGTSNMCRVIIPRDSNNNDQLTNMTGINPKAVYQWIDTDKILLNCFGAAGNDSNMLSLDVNFVRKTGTFLSWGYHEYTNKVNYLPFDDNTPVYMWLQTATTEDVPWKIVGILKEGE